MFFYVMWLRLQGIRLQIVMIDNSVWIFEAIMTKYVLISLELHWITTGFFSFSEEFIEGSLVNSFFQKIQRRIHFSEKFREGSLVRS